MLEPFRRSSIFFIVHDAQKNSNLKQQVSDNIIIIQYSRKSTQKQE